MINRNICRGENAYLLPFLEYLLIRSILKMVKNKHAWNYLIFIENNIISYRLSFFYKQPIYKQLALEYQIAKQLSGLNPLSLRTNKNYS